MEIADIVGIVIAFIAVVYSFVSSLMQALSRRQKESEEKMARDNKPKSKQRRQPPVPPALVTHKEKRVPLRAQTGADERFVFHSTLDEFQAKSAIEDRKLPNHLRPIGELVSEDLRIQQSEGSLYTRQKKAPIHRLIRSLPSKKALVVSYEVFNTPIAFRR